MSNSSEIGERNRRDQPSQSGDDEESISLSDLPLQSTTKDEQAEEIGGNEEAGGGEEFDFGSLAASLDALESEMCAADEVFYRGQILPFGQSKLTRTVSRSESADGIVGSGFQTSSTASSSRSCSTRSSSINSSASAGKLPQINHHSTNSNNNKSPFKVRNQFHSFPSPKPYDRATNAPKSTTTTSANKRSALWEIFRLGLVRTPEIELEDLKNRYNKHQNVSDNGKSVIKESPEVELRGVKNKKGWRKQRFRRKKGTAMNFMSCKCSVGAIEPEKATVVVNKPERVTEEKVTETETEKEERHVSPHHRMTEWLKDLSHSVILNDAST